MYFSADGIHTFSQSELCERVYQKEPSSDSVLVCYCFRYTVGEILEKIRNAEINLIIDEIKLGIQQGQCACDWRNPQGDCCLGNVKLLQKSQSD